MATTTPLIAPDKNFYLLYYRQGNNPHPQFFVFNHDSKDMRVVVERVKKHCELLNLRFVNVRPFLVDLAAAEARLLGNSAEGE